MNPARLMTISCTVTTVTEGAKDQYGDPTESTATTTTTCWLEQIRRDDLTGDTDVQDERWTIYLPSATSLTGRDRVTVDSVAYEVKGPPWEATNPRTGAVEYVAATLVRTS